MRNVEGGGGALGLGVGGPRAEEPGSARVGGTVTYENRVWNVEH